MKKGVRLDRFCTENGFCESLEKAQAEIADGWVKVNGETVRDRLRVIRGTETISIIRPGGPFASRGGQKLDHALNVFGISVEQRIAADLGASTGGFTDCLLKRGAAKVYAVDVGYGQLDYRLRSDARVVVRDRCNVRSLTKNSFDEMIDFVCSDLSFYIVLRCSSGDA